MKRYLFPLLAAAFMLTAASCSDSKYQSVPGDPMHTRIYTLDNGLQVYMTVNKTEPRIQTYIAVKVGSKNDPSETTGLAHYFEHLMFKGTEQFGTSDYAAEKPMLDEIERLFEVYRQTTDEAQRAAIYHQIDSVSYEASKLAIPNEYDKLMALIGADGTNAWTSTDETVYTEDIPSNQIDNWARIQADRFRHNVIRGFHTELETVYEEKNMSLTQDSRKVWEALDQALFPNHPYGKQTTLGTQEHLKNPSITNIKNYYKTYYVPNNIRICLSGDFDPDEMVAVIEKYFGDWEPNPSIPVLDFGEEQPITEPVVKDVYGLEAENMAMAWRLPKMAELKTSASAAIASSILYNGNAGLIDLDVMQRQKVLSLYGGYQPGTDYSQFIIMGRAKEGQSLEEVRDIALEEVAKLRAGDFDESLIQATINNLKLAQMQELENNSTRAVKFVDAFINGLDWKDASRQVEILSGITKDDVVAFANEYLGENSYAIVYKRMGEDKNVQKISAPKITPIVTNRDRQSGFLTDIQNAEVKPIEPVFVDFSKEMSQFELAKGVNVLYKQNITNDIFSIDFVFNTGIMDCPFINTACDYLSYLGTPDMTAGQIASKMYSLACSFSIYASESKTTVSVSGLSENMEGAVRIVEALIMNAVPDESILANVKGDILKSRLDNKTRQRACATALQRYALMGPDYIRKSVMSNDAVSALNSDELLAKIREIFAKGHEIQYYGPMTENDFKAAVSDCHSVTDGAEALAERFEPRLRTDENQVVMTQYDAKQIYYYQYSNRGEKFSVGDMADLELYNEYFGGSMNAIVFQEMREARGLAYSAWARMYNPSFADGDYYYIAFIATQNDKMQTAIEAFDDIINEMPQSEAAFKVAKEALIGRLRTQRVNGAAVLNEYAYCRRMGLTESPDRQIFEKVQSLELKDVVATQQKWVKGRKYTYAILGDIKDLDTKYLSSLGPVKIVSLEEAFGY
ncbi:MAG: insulinase family protein [Alistipes sp.]|nr:insulinase family protein [Candidatus Minthomonas equi]